MSLFSAYRYSPEETRKRFELLRARATRRHFLILLDGRPVGETGIKHIDWEKREGELSIHLQNDAVKNRGIGTAAERLLLAYAFDELGLTAVTAPGHRKEHAQPARARKGRVCVCPAGERLPALPL